MIRIFQTTSSSVSLSHYGSITATQINGTGCDVTHRLRAPPVFLGLGLGGGVGFVLPKVFVMAATRPLSRAFTERLRWSSIVCLAMDRLRMSAAFDFCTGTTYAKSHRFFLLYGICITKKTTQTEPQRTKLPHSG